MLKDFLALYGALRLLDDVTRPSPPNKNGDNALGCGCLVVILIIIFVSCAAAAANVPLR